MGNRMSILVIILLFSVSVHAEKDNKEEKTRLLETIFELRGQPTSPILDNCFGMIRHYQDELDKELGKTIPDSLRDSIFQATREVMDENFRKYSVKYRYDFMKSYYAYFTVDELKELVKFYQNDLGKKLKYAEDDAKLVSKSIEVELLTVAFDSYVRKLKRFIPEDKLKSILGYNKKEWRGR